MNAYVSINTQTLQSIDYTGAKVTRVAVCDSVFNNPTLQDLRKLIFKCIHTRDLLSGLFSSITDDPTRGSSFKKQDGFCAWMCDDDYKYEDGQCITVYIRNSSSNEIMRDVLKALSGDTWTERLFKLSHCEIEMVLKDDIPLTIQLCVP
ncbi:hypothetical protein [Dishui Lake phycodnavirus 3]|nr:hypothetical protein [Dishui Lake phycodnavirus 3]